MYYFSDGQHAPMKHRCSKYVALQVTCPAKHVAHAATYLVNFLIGYGPTGYIWVQQTYLVNFLIGYEVHMGAGICGWVLLCVWLW